MTDNRRLKQDIRARMTVTGEPYSVARRALASAWPTLASLLRPRTPGIPQLDWVVGLTNDGSVPGPSGHTLITGRSTSGPRNALLHSMLIQLMHNNGPEELNLHLYDASGPNELLRYGRVDTLTLLRAAVYGPLMPTDDARRIDFAVRAERDLAALVDEMKRRRKLMAEHSGVPASLPHARVIAIHESARLNQPVVEHPLYLPHIVVVLHGIDELLIGEARTDDDVTSRLLGSITSIAREGRSAGIKLIVTSQQVHNATVPSTLRHNLERVSERLNPTASRFVFGHQATELLGDGEVMTEHGTLVMPSMKQSDIERLIDDLSRPGSMVKPLRKVVSVTETGRRGKDITPHHFWLAKEFRLDLECGHHQLRALDDYNGGYQSSRYREVTDKLPKRARCAECETVPTRWARKR